MLFNINFMFYDILIILFSINVNAFTNKFSHHVIIEKKIK